MLPIKLTVFVVLFVSICQAQTSQSSSSSLADVVVSVTDMEGKGTSGETVVFKTKNPVKSYQVVTARNGKGKIQLPTGGDYHVTLKKLTDSTSYGVLSIPKLEADQFYTEPFAVNIQYQPARTFNLSNVQFDFGKASFKQESLPQLNDLFSFLKNKESVTVEIAGHTDNIGKPADNLKLSKERSESIVKFLVNKGISPSRLKAKGYGDTKPIADNSTDEGRRLNRRTEVIILE